MSAKLLTLRLIAVFLVFLIHFIRIYNFSPFDFGLFHGHILLNGYFGFSILLILSGYLFGRKYILYQRAPSSFKGFTSNLIEIVVNRYIRLLLPITSCMILLFPYFLGKNTSCVLAFPLFFIPSNNVCFHPLGVTWTLPYDFLGILSAGLLVFLIKNRFFGYFSTQQKALFSSLLLIISFFVQLKLSAMFVLGFLLSSFQYYLSFRGKLIAKYLRHARIPSLFLFIVLIYNILHLSDFDTANAGLRESYRFFILFLLLPDFTIPKSPRTFIYSDALFILVLIHYPLLELSLSSGIFVNYFSPWLMSIYLFTVLYLFSILIVSVMNNFKAFRGLSINKQINDRLPNVRDESIND